MTDVLDHARAAVQTWIDAEPGRSGRALQRAADLPDGTISRFLNGGGMDLALLERLARALGTPLAALLGEAAPADNRASLRLIHPDQIARSPLNPRKATALDAGAISDLARSIAEKGVLQPIIARPIDAARWRELTGAEALTGDVFEIVAGERRWRASVHAIEKGMVAEDFAMPVTVRAMDDDELVELALVENIDRADMSALEEADAIAFLHERARVEGRHKDFTQRLAAATGKSDRWVQKRVKLAADLCKDARDRLADGKINLQMAMELSELPAAAQTFALEKITKADSRYRNAEQLQAALLQDLPPEADAIFGMADYDGGVIVRDKVRYLADPKLADKLQKAAIKARIAALQETRAFVEEVRSYYWESDYPEAPKSLKGKSGETKAPWGVVVVREGFGVKFHDRRLKRPERQTPNGHEVSQEAELITQRDAARVGVRQKLAEQIDLLFEARPVDAVRAMVFEAIDRDGTLLSLGTGYDTAEIHKALALLSVEIPPTPDGATAKEAQDAWEKDALARIVAGLKAADERTLWRCVALFIGASRDRHACENQLTPTDVALLTLLDLEVPPPLQHELDGGDILDLASPPPPEAEDEADEGDEGDEGEDAYADLRAEADADEAAE